MCVYKGNGNLGSIFKKFIYKLYIYFIKYFKYQFVLI